MSVIFFKEMAWELKEMIDHRFVIGRSPQVNFSLMDSESRPKTAPSPQETVTSFITQLEHSIAMMGIETGEGDA